MRGAVPIAFKPEGVTLPLDRILPLKGLSKSIRSSARYLRIKASMQEVGIIEPPVVFPQKGKKNLYLMLDGHVRLEIAKALKFESLFCLVATDDEAFTYNHKVNQLQPIQEHFMILRAIKNGVSEERIAKTLNVNVDTIKQKRDLLTGICPEAVELLRHRKASAGAIREMKRVKPMRQIEMAEVMVKHPQSRYREMLDPENGGRRCWTIRYADDSRFHLDILPAIPDDPTWLMALGVPAEWAKDAICITDRTRWKSDADWPRSNPKGYVEWFKDQMLIQLQESHKLLAMEKKADVQDIQDFEVRTPLQRVIQLLKRHRDVRYNGDEDKPVSIIITTLAARAYNNESDMGDAIFNIVPAMRDGIERRDDGWWVANPVNPKENFADKWRKHPRKQEIFFEWLEAVEREHGDLLSDRGFERVGEYLAESYGERAGKATMVKYAGRMTGRTGLKAGPTITIVPARTSSLNETEYPDITIARPDRPWMC